MLHNYLLDFSRVVNYTNDAEASGFFVASNPLVFTSPRPQQARQQGVHQRIAFYRGNMKTKRCPICKENKIRSEFYSRADGSPYGYCKKCQVEYIRKRRKLNPSATKEQDHRLYENRKISHVQYCKKYYSKNRDWYKKYQKEYKKTERAKLLSAIRDSKRRNLKDGKDDLTTEQWKVILYLQSNICADCGIEFTDNCKPRRDHIVPAITGGSLTFSNVQALCHRCNCIKHTDSTDYRWWTGIQYDEIIGYIKI